MSAGKKQKLMKLSTTSYANKIMKRMMMFFDTKYLCDVVLIAGADGRRIPAHRMVLTIASNYFNVMFTKGMKEAKQKEIVLRHINGEVLQLLVTFCYTGELPEELRIDTVETILTTAQFLHLDMVVEECLDFLKDHLSPSNCLGTLYFTERYGFHQIMQLIQNYVGVNLTKVVKCKEFLQLDVDQLFNLLSRDDLNVESEEDIFHCLISWVRSDKRDRKKYVKQLLPVVRLALLSPQFIKEHVETVCTLCKIPDTQLMLQNKQKRQFFGDCLLFCGMKRLQKFCLKMGISLKKSKRPRVNGSFVVFNNKLIVVGESDYDIHSSEEESEDLEYSEGEIDPDYSNDHTYYWDEDTETHEVDYGVVKYFDVEQKIWKKLLKLKSGRYETNLVVLGTSLYAVGGYNSEGTVYSMERLDSLTGKWHEVATLPEILHSAHHIYAVAYNGYIYAEGNYMSNLGIHRYDPNTDEWTYFGSTKLGIQSFAVVAGVLYAYRKPLLQRYDKDNNTWSTCSVICTEVESTSSWYENDTQLFSYDDKLFRSSKKGTDWVFMEFDPINNIWTEWYTHKYAHHSFTVIPRTVF